MHVRYMTTIIHMFLTHQEKLGKMFDTYVFYLSGKFNQYIQHVTKNYLKLQICQNEICSQSEIYINPTGTKLEDQQPNEPTPKPPQVAHFLTNAKADVALKDSRGDTALHIAAAMNLSGLCGCLRQTTSRINTWKQRAKNNTYGFF